jgi:NitT/TauT family transport system substrate-binding protein
MQQKQSLAIFFCLFLLISVLGFTPSFAAESIRAAYASVGGQTAPLWIAQKEGYFKKHGLDVQLIYIPGSSTVVQALLGGDIQIANIGGPSTISANLAGADTVVVASAINRLVMSLYAVPAVKSPADLKGKRVGITRFGSTSDFSVRYALRRLGLDPNQDVIIVQLGDQATRIAAMRTGSLPATVIQPPMTLVMKKEGYNRLADLTEMGLEYPLSSLVTRRSLLQSRPQTVKSFIMGYAEGAHYFKTNPSGSLRYLAQIMRMSLDKPTDREALEETYREYANITEDVPVLTPAGVKTLLKQLSDAHPKWKKISPDEAGVDMRLVQELEKEGFFRGLSRNP